MADKPTQPTPEDETDLTTEPEEAQEEGTPEAPEVLPAPVEAEALDQVAASLNNLQRGATLQLALGVGKIIIDGLYEGDREAWKSRGTKDTSFRKLAARDDVSMSKATLQRAVAVYVMVEDLQLDVSTWRHVGLSHARAVLGLPGDKQKQYLESAEEQGWSVKKLEGYVRRVRPRDGRGRPELPGFVKGIGQLGRLAENRDLLFGGLEKLDELGDAEAQALTEKIEAVMEVCRSLQEKLRARDSTPGEE